jgi:hypothetical protein
MMLIDYILRLTTCPDRHDILILDIPLPGKPL